MHIGIDGQLEKIEDKNIYVSEGINFGYSIFETIKVINGKMMLFGRHIERLNKSLNMLGIDFKYELESIRKQAESIIAANDFEDGAVKILSSKNSHSSDGISTVISVRKAVYPEELYNRGFKLKVSRLVRNEKSILPRIKSSNYLDNLFEKKKAVDEGYDDALFLNTEGNIAETCISNIFFIKDRKIYTPSEECGLLRGIVRDLIIELLESKQMNVIEGKFNIEDILYADEVFVTNSLMGVMPVSSICLENAYSIEDAEKNNTDKSDNEDGCCEFKTAKNGYNYDVEIVNSIISKEYEKYLLKDV